MTTFDEILGPFTIQYRDLSTRWVGVPEGRWHFIRFETNGRVHRGEGSRKNLAQCRNAVRELT